MRRYSVVCGLSGSAIFFPHYLVKDTVFGRNFIEYKMCVLIFSATFIRNISHFKKIQRDAIINARGSSCKIPVIRVRF